MYLVDHCLDPSENTDLPFQGQKKTAYTIGSVLSVNKLGMEYGKKEYPPRNQPSIHANDTFKEVSFLFVKDGRHLPIL
jgi:hypothetical protein